MEYDPKDNEVIHLLNKLKDSNGTYPPEMLALRRQGYLRQVAQVSAGVGFVIGLKNILKGGNGSAGLPPAAGTIVEALLVIAIVVEAAAVTYFYRDKLVDAYQSSTNSSKVQEISGPPDLPSPIPGIEFTASPVITVALTETETLALTATSTPSPEIAAQSTQQNGDSGVTGATSSGTGSAANSGSVQPTSTQDPNVNNGNHYGQTPLPERTKEPGNDVSTQNRQENNTNITTNTNTNTKTKKKP